MRQIGTVSSQLPRAARLESIEQKSLSFCLYNAKFAQGFRNWAGPTCNAEQTVEGAGILSLLRLSGGGKKKRTKAAKGSLPDALRSRRGRGAR